MTDQGVQRRIDVIKANNQVIRLLSVETDSAAEGSRRKSLQEARLRGTLVRFE